MILRYSWKRISKVAGRSSQRILTALQSMLTNQMPRNKYDLLYTYIQRDFSGDCYLLNPWPLVYNNEGYTPKERADYIGLASLRNYAEYLVTNDASLDIFHSPLPEEKLKQNRLLSIHNGRIYFKYEEVTNRRK